MANDGKAFEILAKDLFELLSKADPNTSVEGPRVFIDSPDGPREFDLVLRSKVSNLDILTVIECRDYSRKLNVSHIDGFKAKMDDVRANKGVLVSRKGFTGTAIRKARRVGISLFVADSVRDEIAKSVQTILFPPIMSAKIDRVIFTSNFEYKLLVQRPLSEDEEVVLDQFLADDEKFLELWREAVRGFNGGELPDLWALLRAAIVSGEIRIDKTRKVRRWYPKLKNERCVVGLLGWPHVVLDAFGFFIEYRLDDVEIAYGNCLAIPETVGMFEVTEDGMKTSATLSKIDNDIELYDFIEYDSEAEIKVDSDVYLRIIRTEGVHRIEDAWNSSVPSRSADFFAKYGNDI